MSVPNPAAGNITPPAPEGGAAPAPKDHSAEIAKLTAAFEASSKESGALKKALADTQAELAARKDPKSILAEAAKALGLGAEEDPKAKLANTESALNKWKKTALDKGVQLDAVQELLGAKVKPERIKQALRLLDTSGVDVDEATGSVKDKTVLTQRIADLKTGTPEWFDAVAAASQTPAGAPLPTARPPGPGGSQPTGPTGKAFKTKAEMEAMSTQELTAYLATIQPITSQHRTQ